jgi:hypothetical protein
MWTDLNSVLTTELEKAENSDIVQELRDPDYASRQHYSRSTYASGCRGPLCRKSEKDRGRKRNEQRATEAGRIYTPSVDEEANARDPLLDMVIHWHLTHPDEVERRAEAYRNARANKVSA